MFNILQYNSEVKKINDMKNEIDKLKPKPAENIFTEGNEIEFNYNNEGRISGVSFLLNNRSKRFYLSVEDYKIVMKMSRELQIQ